MHRGWLKTSGKKGISTMSFRRGHFCLCLTCACTRTTQKCLLHVTSLQCVEAYYHTVICGFLDAFRNSLHYGTLWAVFLFLFLIFGGSKMHAFIFCWIYWDDDCSSSPLNGFISSRWIESTVAPICNIETVLGGKPLPSTGLV